MMQRKLPMIGNILARLKSLKLRNRELNLGRSMRCHVSTDPLKMRQRFPVSRLLPFAFAFTLCFTTTLAAPAPAQALPSFLQGFSPRASSATNSAISNAYHQKMSDLIVEGVGTVERLLPDDNIGSRHQRFIVRLSPAHTVLVSHNIDLAPKVPNLREGNEISFKGEYEWSELGGIVHWTHRDPRGNDHPDGWIEYKGDRYE